jgi:hypothetical protein
MASYECPDLLRGATETGSEVFDNVLGRVYEWEDVLWSSTETVKALRTGKKVYTMLCKNSSGAALLPKRLVVRKAGTTGEVDGYTDVSGERPLGIVGVADGDYFWVVVEGPSLCLTDLAGAANNLIPADTLLIALTAATSGATTAGRVAPATILSTAATTYTGTELLDFINKAGNAIGVALTAKTTTQTNNDILVNTKFKWY